MRSEEDLKEFLRTDVAVLREHYAERHRQLQEQGSARPLPRHFLWWLGAAVAASLVAGSLPLLLLAGYWLATQGREVVRSASGARRYRADLKRDLVGAVVRFWLPGLRFDADRGIPRETFDASRLFEGERYDAYAARDLVHGRVGSTRLQLSEVRVTRRERRERSRVVFRGLFFAADFHKEFRGETRVLPDVAERRLGRFGRAFQDLRQLAGPERLVELESPEFEREFVVTSTDPLEARYLLTPDMMERILRFRRNTGSALRLSLLRGSVSLALPLAQDLFELPVGSVFPDEAAIRRWLGELDFAVGIAGELDLETRIWSKAPDAPPPPPGGAGPRPDRAR